ncbi:hypothetical protein ACHAXA_001924 [Cyclostephanos tholiformis]|uniref:Uncharacterized protein n=1 Tax=Cyclostephanos tholiformis TaxID=382380 RepID=A0ABD3R6N6_9STRA
MARFTTALGLLLTAATAVAFCPDCVVVSRRNILHRLGAVEDTDFDAPVPLSPQSGTAVLDREPIVDDECYMGKDGGADECVDFDPAPRRTTRSANAYDRPRSTPKWTVADDFDAPVPAYPKSGTAVLDHEPIVDDECYMGKDGGANECVDFDPAPRRTTRSANAYDRPRSTPKWTVADDFDAPVPAYPKSGTAVLDREPIVDDECYMGKDGGANECVDFDPAPRRTTRSANAYDRPRSTPKWTVADDFDAPVPAYPKSGRAVLDREPIVDDECYMGKDGGADECVDFDPSPRRTTRSANAQDRPRSSPRWTSFLRRSGLPETTF